MRYQILGPVELLGAQGRLGGPKQRAVLALLLLNANKVVSEQRFRTFVWGDDPPLSVRGQLQMYVSQLRKLLDEPVIVRRPPGYLIQVRPGELDLDVFDERVRQARVELVAGRTGDAADGLRAALAMWQGPVLGGVPEQLAGHEGPALAARRLAVLEEYFDVRFAAGQHGEVLREVQEAAGENPLRERLQAQLMLALHEAGRTAEALAVYTATRSLMLAEQGAEPGKILRETQLRLLRAEGGPPKPAPTPSMPRQLPGDLPVFAGRAAELARLAEVLPASTVPADPAASVVVVSGGAGVGKTTLAVHWAHRVAERFPDGLLYVNLRGFDPGGHAMAPDEAVRGFLEALNVPATGLPAGADARFSLYRSVLADKRVLVVLDNARDAEQVRPLLPGSPGCATVVTSRDQLPSLIAADGAVPVEVGLLSAGEARDVLARRLGPVRVDAEPDAVVEIGELCARLPLALAIVAARAATNPDFSLASLAKELRDEGGLDALETGDSAVSVRVVFSWSYLALTEPAARLFRLLGLHPGPHVTVPACASLAGVPERQARALLGELARAHLIVEAVPGRYGFHDLLRAYASELADATDPEPARRAAVHRGLDHYLHTTEQAANLLRPQRSTPIPLAPPQDGVTVRDVRTEQQALDWFAAEHTVLHAMVGQAAQHGFDSHPWQLVDALSSTLWHCGSRWLGDRHGYETALAAARRLDDPRALAFSHRAFAAFHLTHEQYPDAETELTAAAALFERLGDTDLLADVHQGLSAVTGRLGRYAQMRRHVERCIELFHAAGNRLGVANSQLHLAYSLVRVGEPEQAIAVCEQAIELFTHLPRPNNEAAAWDHLGDASFHTGRHTEAIAARWRAVGLHREAGSSLRELESLREIGDIHHLRGEDADARTAWRQALDISTELNSQADGLRDRLTQRSTVRSASSAKRDG